VAFLVPIQRRLVNPWTDQHPTDIARLRTGYAATWLEQRLRLRHSFCWLSQL
jgi:hypothetical protein